MQKTCSKCGTTFGCKNEAPGCWCESIYVDVPTLASLKEQFDNCLCPACLQSYSRLPAPHQEKVNNNT